MIGPDVKYQRAKQFSSGTEYEIFRYNYCDNGCIFHKERGDGFPAFLEDGGCPIEDGLEGGRFDNSVYPSVLLEVWEEDKCRKWHHCPFFTKREK